MDLDRWTAENVMIPGNVTRHGSWYDVHRVVDGHLIRCRKYEIYHVWAGGCINGWHPTRDITQAFDVVEKMREKGWSFELGDNHHEGKWYAIFEIPMTDNQHYGFADTPALAICEAAKKAVEGNHEV